MIVSQVTYRDWRNISEGQVQFKDGINVLWGMNAQGKSNILEGIYYFARGRSFRGAKEREFIRFGADFASAAIDYRRDGYDFDARWDDGLAPMKDKQIMDVFLEFSSMMTHELKAKCNYGKQGQKGFETVITRLQMQTYLVVQNFEYRTDKTGKPYGWGIARYATPEVQFGTEMIENAYREEPKDAAKRIADYLETLLPDASVTQIEKLIG